MATSPSAARTRTGKGLPPTVVSTASSDQSSSHTRKGLVRAPARSSAPRSKRSWASNLRPRTSVTAKCAM